MKTYDWDFSGINSAIGKIGEAIKANRDREQMQTIGNLIAGGDYRGASKAAFAAGNGDIGLKLLQAGIDREDQAKAGGLAQSLMGLNPASSTDSQPQTLSGLTSGGGANAGGAVGDMSNYANAISGVESGGRYDIVGPTHPRYGRALGKYQVMETNVGPWTQEALGQRLTPDQFLASPQAQDAVFNYKFGQSVQKYGNPQDAASVWFSGKPMREAGNRADSLGTTVPEYVAKFNRGMGQPMMAGTPYQGAEIPSQMAAAAPQAPQPVAQTPTIQGFDPDATRGVNPGLMNVVARAQQIDPGAFALNPDTKQVRTQADQDEYVDKGWSKTRDSYHLHGNAIDLVPINPQTGKPDANYTAGYARIQKAMQQAAAEQGVGNLGWGGNWKSFQDRPHWELQGSERTALADGATPGYVPPQTLPQVAQLPPQRDGSVPRSIAGPTPVAPTTASAPPAGSVPIQLAQADVPMQGGQESQFYIPSTGQRVAADGSPIAPPMSAPSADRPDWLSSRVPASAGQPGASAAGPSVAPTANHDVPAYAPATIGAGSPAARSGTNQKAANSILAALAGPWKFTEGQRQALLKKYEQLTNYDKDQLGMELQQLQAQKARGDIAMQPLEMQGKQLSNATAQRALDQPQDPDQRGYALARSQGYGGSFMDYKTSLAKSGASTTVLKDEDARDKTAGAAIGEEIGSYIKAARPAAQSIQQLSLMKSALDSGGGNISTGPLAETMLKGKQALSNAFGIDVAGLPETEALQKLGFGLATQAVQAISSRPTQMEFGRALENNPGIFLSRQGNLAMIDILQQQKRQEVDLARLAAKRSNWDNWSDVVENYYATHPIRSPFDKTKDFGADDIQRLSNQPDAPAAGPRPQRGAQPSMAPPKIGEIQRGYRFKGGNPADQNAWEKAQ